MVLARAGQGARHTTGRVGGSMYQHKDVSYNAAYIERARDKLYRERPPGPVVRVKVRQRCGCRKQGMRVRWMAGRHVISCNQCKKRLAIIETPAKLSVRELERLARLVKNVTVEIEQ
ncbi:MAG: hypothetical protein D6698_12715 [Gammaproteobacteria bacterium]|nr:MAG: hypothetical protein D6698_12715 [Gammaproteobacteria bacterium]